MIAAEWVSPVALARPICLPGTVRRHGTSLLNQQFWLWGQDIRRDGNVLLRYGFERTRPPDGVHGSRSYMLQLDADLTVVLWGFGLFLGDRELGGLYLSRFRLFPLLTGSGRAPEGIWSPAQLPACRPPSNQHEWASARLLFVSALHWMGAY